MEMTPTGQLLDRSCPSPNSSLLLTRRWSVQNFKSIAFV